MKIASYKQHEKIDNYYQELHKIIKDNKLNYKVIGKVSDYEIGLITPKKFNKKLPSLLIAAGFHGNEPAGILGLLEYLKKDTSPKVNVSFIPIVNPTGYMLNTRENYLKENPNRNYCHDQTLPEKAKGLKPSKEAKILIENLDELLECSRDGFLTLHEDNDKEKYYIYMTDSIDNEYETNKLITYLKKSLSKYFKIDMGSTIEGDEAENGIIKYAFCGSFEDLLYLKGIERTVVTETPGKMDINDRIKANRDVISKFIEFYSL
jgi:hypothetical protein